MQGVPQRLDLPRRALEPSIFKDFRQKFQINHPNFFEYALHNRIARAEFNIMVCDSSHGLEPIRHVLWPPFGASLSEVFLCLTDGALSCLLDPAKA